MQPTPLTKVLKRLLTIFIFVLLGIALSFIPALYASAYTYFTQARVLIAQASFCGSGAIISTSGLFSGFDGKQYFRSYDFSRGQETINSAACGREYQVQPDPQQPNYGIKFVYLVDSFKNRVSPTLYVEEADGTLRQFLPSSNQTNALSPNGVTNGASPGEITSLDDGTPSVSPKPKPIPAPQRVSSVASSVPSIFSTDVALTPIPTANASSTCSYFGSYTYHYSVYNGAQQYRTHLASQEAATRLSISLIKHRVRRAFAFSRVLSKFLTRLLHLSTQALLLSTIQRIGITTKPDFPWAFFSAFDCFGATLNRIFVMIWG